MMSSNNEKTTKEALSNKQKVEDTNPQGEATQKVELKVEEPLEDDELETVAGGRNLNPKMDRF